jgi:TolA-binding protein
VPIRSIHQYGFRSIGLAAILISSGFCVSAAEPAPTGLVQASLPELLEQASSAFASGNFNAAAELFAAVERDYGQEADWTNGDLPRRVLPLKGFAELKSGQANAAAETLTAFLERYPDDRVQGSSARYTLAIALRQAGRAEEALERFRDYETQHPDGRQIVLALFQEAEILFELDQLEKGFAVLDRIRTSDAAESLKLQARLLGVQRAIDHGKTEIASNRLLAEPWHASTMPEIAVLAFAGLELGDHLMESERYTNAVRAYRLVPPRSELIALQRERLQDLKDRMQWFGSSIEPAATSFWVNFYRGMIDRIEHQLAALEDADDYTPSLILRRAQAFLLAGRPREAWLLCEYLALDKQLGPQLREDAHYRWILAASNLDRWEDALAIARDFVTRHPSSERAPEVFYSMAQAHLEQRRLPEAEEVLNDLINRFPDHHLHARFLFLRGYVRTVQEHFAEARSDFGDCRALYPEGPLSLNCGLWHGLTWFFERDYKQALTELESLMPLAREHYLYPEITYRIASTRYAQRDLDRAGKDLEGFLQEFPGHGREAEARVLLGDTLMGSGDLDRALDTFRKVPEEMETQSTYAAFQIGKILKAQENYEELSDHFEAYGARPGPPPRVSEALYWVGWAEDRMGRPGSAEPIFLDALARFGNDPEATEVMAIIKGLGRLNRVLGREPGAFDDWIESETTSALAQERFTYFARLRLHQADRHLTAGRSYAAEALLLEIAAKAPLEALDPVALGRVGTTLMEIGAPSAEDYFHRLLSTYPKSFDRAYAWYGLGKTAYDAGDDATAVDWLDRCPAETPTHPVAPRALLIGAGAHLNLGAPERAAAGYNEILKMKSARGRLHADALATSDTARAIACFQRIYTLYQAYSDLVSEAYYRSAVLFEERGDLEAAYNSFRELADDQRLRDTAFYLQALDARDRLEPKIRDAKEPSS